MTRPVGGVLAAGGAGQKRLLEPLGDEPLLHWSLTALTRLCERVVVVVPSTATAGASEVAAAADGWVELIQAAEERWEGVRLALDHLAEDCEFVVVHDPLRPFAAGDLFQRVLAMAKEEGAATTVVSTGEVVKEVDFKDRVMRTLLPARLRIAQTPEAFHLPLLRECLEAQARGELDVVGNFRDVASFVEAAGGLVHTVEGSPDNVRLTSEEDWQWARDYAQRLGPGT